MSRSKRHNQGRGPGLFALAPDAMGSHLGPPPSLFNVFLFSFLLKTYITSGKCYQNNFFPIALPIFFVFCSNNGRSRCTVPIKVTVAQLPRMHSYVSLSFQAPV